MFNYATKNALKGSTEFDISNLALKSDLASLKAEIDKIDIEKLKTVPDNLTKLSNTVNYEVFKKTVW